jgi:hypothetical protein
MQCVYFSASTACPTTTMLTVATDFTILVKKLEAVATKRSQTHAPHSVPEQTWCVSTDTEKAFVPQAALFCRPLDTERYIAVACSSQISQPRPLGGSSMAIKVLMYTIRDSRHRQPRLLHRALQHARCARLLIRILEDFAALQTREGRH